MKKVKIGSKPVSAIVQGCMRLESLSVKEIRNLIDLHLDAGVNFWDHADIYGEEDGACEALFGEALRGMPGIREKLILQSKCGIRSQGFTIYDFSKEHIIHSVESSLQRLGTDHLDYLLLHRPDLLMQPEEVAEAFEKLKMQGKVLHFGVSNHTPGQIEVLKTAVNVPIEINQLQFSLAHTLLLDASAYLNTNDPLAVSRDADVLNYCRLNHVTIQCYSPFQYGAFEGSFLGNPRYEKLNSVLKKLAQKYGTTENGIAAAWILRHPAEMQVVIGTTNAQRILGILQAADITLTREEWYELYAAEHRLP